jgi:hypothetical protein
MKSNLEIKSEIVFGQVFPLTLISNICSDIPEIFLKFSEECAIEITK